MLWVTMFLAWFFQASPLGTQEGCNYGQAAGIFQNRTLTGVQHIFPRVIASGDVVRPHLKCSFGDFSLGPIENPF